ncbi:MAG: hypothetical protein WC824_11990 [Bacteroidota bacterium]|jgi:hypothetical protein
MTDIQKEQIWDCYGAMYLLATGLGMLGVAGFFLVKTIEVITGQ